MSSPALIREARLRAGLTQAQLAERVGTSQSAVARWEGGRTRPSLETVRRIVRACGFELRTGLEEADPEIDALLADSLRRTPEERFDRLVRTVSFVHSGRRALSASRG